MGEGLGSCGLFGVWGEGSKGACLGGGRCHDILIMVSVKMLQAPTWLFRDGRSRDVICPRSAWTQRVEGACC